MNAIARQPAGAPDSTGGQFAPTSRPDTPVDLTTSPSPTTADVDAVRAAIEARGDEPVADHRGHAPDPNLYWSDSPDDVALAATRALYGYPHIPAAAHVIRDRETFQPDSQYIGAHFDVTDLTHAIQAQRADDPEPGADISDFDLDVRCYDCAGPTEHYNDMGGDWDEPQYWCDDCSDTTTLPMTVDITGDDTQLRDDVTGTTYPAGFADVVLVKDVDPDDPWSAQPVYRGPADQARYYIEPGRYSIVDNHSKARIYQTAVRPTVTTG